MYVFNLFDSLDSSILRNLSYQCFRIVLSILGIIFVCILTIARIYRNFFYKE